MTEQAHQEEQRLADPSANVLMLVGNATKYLENMHNSLEHNFDSKLQVAIEASRRERSVETDRIDSRWAADATALVIANERAVKQAEVLAAQMAANAETLRASVSKTAETLSASVAKTAETIALQLQQVTEQLIGRIAALEKAQYENVGKQGISTPLMMMLAGTAGAIILSIIQAVMKL